MNVMAKQLEITLDSFDGPLSLLLYLIQKEEMRIDQLDLCKVTQRYLDYLELIQELNFDLASEYLFMAANLVWIKSRHLVSDDPLAQQLINKEEGQEFIESEEDLMLKLKRLELFQSLGKKFQSLQHFGVDTFSRKKVDKKKLFNLALASIDKQRLIEQMLEVLKKDGRKFAFVKRDRLSIKEKLLQLKKIFSTGSTHDFESLCLSFFEKSDEKLSSLENEADEVDSLQLEQKKLKALNQRIDKVITFISLLELARLSRVSLWQADYQGPIEISVLSSLEHFDIETANGFEEEEAQHGEQPSPTPTLNSPNESADESARESVP